MKVTKHKKKTITHKRTMMSALSKQVTTRLQGIEKTVSWQKQTRNTNKDFVHKRSTALKWSVRR